MVEFVQNPDKEQLADAREQCMEFVRDEKACAPLVITPELNGGVVQPTNHWHEPLFDFTRQSWEADVSSRRWWHRCGSALSNAIWPKGPPYVCRPENIWRNLENYGDLVVAYCTLGVWFVGACVYFNGGSHREDLWFVGVVVAEGIAVYLLGMAGVRRMARFHAGEQNSAYPLHKLP